MNKPLPRHIVIPLREVSREIDPYFNFFEDEYHIERHHVIEIFTDYWHNYIKAKRQDFTDGVPTSIYEYLTRWLIEFNGGDEDIDFDDMLPAFEEVITVLYNQLFTTMTTLYRLESLAHPLEFLRWHADDVILIKATPARTHRYLVEGSFTGGDRYGD